jgi:uncharacterized iron-regulated membrane protein
MRAATLRRLWLNIHLWIGVGLAALLIPISISGGLLVWHDEIDTLINPQRYAVSGGQVALPPSAYLAKAAEAVAKDPADLRVTGVRYPDEGWPVRVVTRAANSEPGKRPRFVTVFLDPPTGNVLDVMEFGSSFIGFLHVFHENLTLPQYNGRQIVGWAGTGMLVLSLTGIWLWWPRNGGFLRGLRWLRSPHFTFNLHNMLGFWISIPLAVVSLTGIYLSFPQTARDLMSSVATVTPNARGGFGGDVVRQPNLTADRALEIARTAEPNANPLVVLLPVQQRAEGNRAPEASRAPEANAAPDANRGGGNRGGEGARQANRGAEGRPAGPGPSWRVQLSPVDSNDTVTVMVDDRSGRAAPTIVPQSGDRAASWIRWIHEGSHSGPVWMVIVFLTGIFPTIFAITGVIMWLRKRAAKKTLKQGAAQLRPAE